MLANRNLPTKIIILILLVFFMTGCSHQVEDIIDVSETADLNEISAATQIKEIPVYFPFQESQHYSLTLALTDESNSEYELRLYGNNKRLLQQIPCGILTEPIQFSYDDLTYGVYSGLEIFPAENTTGLFFTWKDERFSENAIEIPKYTEVRGTAILAVSDEETSQVKKIYQYNRYQNRIDELRRWQLQKDTRVLEIWDYLENQKLFEGTILLDDKGKPINKEYYDLLLWDDLYLPGDLGDTSDEKTINTWIDEPNIQSAELLGNDIQMGECESREVLLSALGFEDSTPMYQYFDHFHNLRLELYKNALTEQFCGIAHEYTYNNEWKKTEVMYGFILNEIQESEWSGDTAFSLKAVDGTDGARFVDEYEEIIEYTPAGNPDYFRSQGMMEQEEDWELKELLSTVVEINFIYRDDGTLYCRNYSHNQRIFGTTLLSRNSYYDEYGRVSYENGYITHGMLEYYYIYEDESEKPAYLLELDYNLGYAIPSIVHYN